MAGPWDDQLVTWADPTITLGTTLSGNRLVTWSEPIISFALAVLPTGALSGRPEPAAATISAAAAAGFLPLIGQPAPARVTIGGALASGATSVALAGTPVPGAITVRAPGATGLLPLVGQPTPGRLTLRGSVAAGVMSTVSVGAPADSHEMRVADRFGALLSGPVTLPAVNVAWSVELGGSGFLSFDVDARTAAIVASPTMLDDCVFKLAIPLAAGETPTEIAAYANRARNGVLWSGAGRQIRQVRSAPTLWTAWAQDAVLYPEANTLAQMAGEQRYFGFQSTIYHPDADTEYDWDTPSDSTGTQASATGKRNNKPDGWPSALSGAYWITRGATSDGMRHLFVADVTIATAVMVKVWFSADESCAVYFAGELIIQTSSSETGYEQMDTWQAWVQPGTYRVAIDKTSIVSRGGDGVDPVLLAVAAIDDSDGIEDVLLTTSAGAWQVHTMDPVDGIAPALTPGQIALELHAQASSRGVNTWAAITPDFDAAEDSDGTPWPVREERTWRVIYDSGLDMLEGLGDLGFCPEITPALTWRAWSDRGTDRSGSVTIEALVNADSIVENGVGVLATVLPVETQDGWVTVSNPSAVAAYGRREQGLSLGNAPSIAQGKRLGQRVLDERLARPTTEWSVEFYALAGSTPFRDFNLGDTVSVKIGATSTDRVVLAIGGTAEHIDAITRFTITTGPVL